MEFIVIAVVIIIGLGYFVFRDTRSLSRPVNDATSIIEPQPVAEVAPVNPQITDAVTVAVAEAPAKKTRKPRVPKPVAKAEMPATKKAAPKKVAAVKGTIAKSKKI